MNYSVVEEGGLATDAFSTWYSFDAEAAMGFLEALPDSLEDKSLIIDWVLGMSDWKTAFDWIEGLEGRLMKKWAFKALARKIPEEQFSAVNCV